jgi:hypothetical protein
LKMKLGPAVVYPSLSSISDFAQHMRSLMPDSYGLATFSLSASTQDALIAKLRDEIVTCYKEDHGQISLNKFVENEFSFTMFVNSSFSSPHIALISL